MNTSPPPRVVVVADADPEIRSIVTEFLAVYGFTVVQAVDRAELSAQLERHRPVAVILGLDTPRVDDVEAVRRMRAAHPGLRVVVTASATDAYQSALSAGATAVLAKPLPLPDLLRAVSTGTSEPPASFNTPAGDTPGTAARHAPGPGPARGRIVVVDDDADLRAVLVEMLAVSGHDILAVGTAADAVRVVAEHRPDVMLLDIYMPGMTGVDALPILRQIAPAMRVIMISGGTDEEAARRALGEGAFDYVVKPVSMRRLAEVVETALLFRP